MVKNKAQPSTRTNTKTCLDKSHNSTTAFSRGKHRVSNKAPLGNTGQQQSHQGAQRGQVTQQLRQLGHMYQRGQPGGGGGNVTFGGLGRGGMVQMKPMKSQIAAFGRGSSGALITSHTEHIGTPRQAQPDASLNSVTVKTGLTVVELTNELESDNRYPREEPPPEPEPN
ncbi:hypothetical protein LTR09_012491 [Extremus antarcticus]|uniref:Uncharacterized protein n=1 Tax=Extremus antarcticus TaxID=702011 RepID=A0AAJ0D517_9PEZI|nr:hypothetical protein LTR09_012491 [Extremus antarcticus]